MGRDGKSSLGRKAGRHEAGASTRPRKTRSKPKGRTVTARTGKSQDAKASRLARELKEALAQQAASSDVLQVINSSPGNLAPVFQAIVDKALQTCDAKFGGLWIVDG